jgi:hypothetical protein
MMILKTNGDSIEVYICHCGALVALPMMEIHYKTMHPKVDTAAPAPEPQEADRVKVAKILCGHCLSRYGYCDRQECFAATTQKIDQIITALRKEPEKPQNIHDDIYFGKPYNHTCDNCKNTGTCSGEGMVINCTNWNPKSRRSQAASGW